MQANHDVQTRGATSVERKSGESPTATDSRTRQKEAALVPAVDIFEDAHQITVLAEVPGVSKETLNVRVDGNSLLIEGDIALELPSGMSALYADLQNTKYRRSFILSGELETERIAANLKDGLLTVLIPKRPEFRTRKIKVDVA